MKIKVKITFVDGSIELDVFEVDNISELNNAVIKKYGDGEVKEIEVVDNVEAIECADVLPPPTMTEEHVHAMVTYTHALKQYFDIFSKKRPSGRSFGHDIIYEVEQLCRDNGFEIQITSMTQEIPAVNEATPPNKKPH